MYCIDCVNTHSPKDLHILEGLETLRNAQEALREVLYGENSPWDRDALLQFLYDAEGNFLEALDPPIETVAQ